MQALLSLVAVAALVAVGQAPAPPAPGPGPAPPKPAPKAPSIKLDVAKKGKPGRYLPLKAITEGKTCLWVPLDPGLEFLPAELAPADSHVNAAYHPEAGKFRFLVITAVGDLPLYHAAAVTFEGSKPGPGPGPPPPAPPSGLGARLQTAYNADPEAAAVKAGHKALLLGLYEAMIDHAKNPAITTTAELLADLKKVADKMIAPAALVEMRKIIAAEVGTEIGYEVNAQLDPLRGKAVAVFTRVVQGLKEVK